MSCHLWLGATLLDSSRVGTATGLLDTGLGEGFIYHIFITNFFVHFITPETLFLSLHVSDDPQPMAELPVLGQFNDLSGSFPNTSLTSTMVQKLYSDLLKVVKGPI